MECDAFREDLMDVLYGEADAATAHRFNEHQARCASCREELTSFRRVRHELDGWAVTPSRRATWPAALRPLRVLAAAAGLLAAAGGALVLAKGEIRYPNGQVALRLAAPSQDSSELRRLLAEQDARHAREIAALKATVVPASHEVDGSAERTADQAALLAEVRRLLKESEARQAAVFTAGLTDLEERTQAQHRVDLAQMGASMAYLDGKAGLQAARTTALMDKVLVASQGGR
jgi:hypothetical protein